MNEAIKHADPPQHLTISPDDVKFIETKRYELDQIAPLKDIPVEELGSLVYYEPSARTQAMRARLVRLRRNADRDPRAAAGKVVAE